MTTPPRIRSFAHELCSCLLLLACRNGVSTNSLPKTKSGTKRVPSTTSFGEATYTLGKNELYPRAWWRPSAHRCRTRRVCRTCRGFVILPGSSAARATQFHHPRCPSKYFLLYYVFSRPSHQLPSSDACNFQTRVRKKVLESAPSQLQA